MRNKLLILGGLAIVGLAVFYLLRSEVPAPQATFTTLTGQRLALADLKGKVVIVNFWATSCPGCIAEMPDLIRTHNAFHARGLETVAVAMSYDPPAYVLSYAQRNKLPFTVALDLKGEAARVFGDIKLTPTTFVIDKTGNIIQKTVGILDFPKLHTILRKELAKQGE